MGEAGIVTRFKNLVLESTTLRTYQDSCQDFYSFKYNELEFAAGYILFPARESPRFRAPKVGAVHKTGALRRCDIP